MEWDLKKKKTHTTQSEWEFCEWLGLGLVYRDICGDVVLYIYIYSLVDPKKSYICTIALKYYSVCRVIKYSILIRAIHIYLQIYSVIISDYINFCWVYILLKCYIRCIYVYSSRQYIPTYIYVYRIECCTIYLCRAKKK